MSNNPDTVRAFMALALPATVTHALGGLCQQWADRWPDAGVRWVPGVNIHLTLRFLGNIARTSVGTFQAALEQTAASVGPFELVFGTVGAFPNQRQPRVVWVGPVEGEAELMALKDRLDGQLATRDWPADERRFRPHLTVGRVRREAEVPADLWETQVHPLRFRAERLQLIESRLKPQRAEYHLLHEAVLTVQ